MSGKERTVNQVGEGKMRVYRVKGRYYTVRRCCKVGERDVLRQVKMG